MAISFWSHPNSNDLIATQFSTCHDSCAVMACAKLCGDMKAWNGIMLKQIFHWIWITVERVSVKWAPRTSLPRGYISSQRVHLFPEGTSPHRGYISSQRVHLLTEGTYIPELLPVPVSSWYYRHKSTSQHTHHHCVARLHLPRVFFLSIKTCNLPIDLCVDSAAYMMAVTPLVLICFFFDAYILQRSMSPNVPRIMHNILHHNKSILLQNIPRNVHKVCALLCFVVIQLYLYPVGSFHWHSGNHIRPVFFRIISLAL